MAECEIHEGARKPCARCAQALDQTKAIADELGAELRKRRSYATPQKAEHIEKTRPRPMQGWKRRTT